jgi:hypothetical protein
MFSPAIEGFLAELDASQVGIREYAQYFRDVLAGIDREADRNPLACAIMIRLERFLAHEVPLPRRICTAAEITLNMN